VTDPHHGTDVVDELTTDHKEALGLLDRALSASEPEERRDLVDTAISEVVRHAVAEEMYVYPAMREHLRTGTTWSATTPRSTSSWRR
jgi:hemerythrin superfamily protein